MYLQDITRTLVTYTDHVTRVFSTKDNLIQVMPWESAAASAIGISTSQLRYVLSLFLALFVGAGIRFIKGTRVRHLYAAVTGLLLVYYPFGSGVLQVAPPAVLTYLVMLLLPRHCGVLAWLINFPYLIWLHVINASGVSNNQGDLDFLGGDMVLVLKLISLAVCYQDHFKAAAQLSEFQGSHLVVALPSPLEYTSYCFGLGNLLAGPFLEYAEYSSFIQLQGVWDTAASRHVPVSVGLGIQRLGEALLFMALHVVLIEKLGWGISSHFWFRDDSYKSLPLLQRLGCQVVCGFAHQLKYYFVWKMAESAATFSGLNFSGWGEDGKPVWGRCCNVHFFGMWLSEYARDVPKHWNIGTANFLKRYVFDRVVPSSGKSGLQHLLITQLVTAFWHGVYPGYMIFFVGTVFYLNAARVIFKVEQWFPAALRRSLPWTAIKIMWTDVAVCYMAMAFVILEYGKSLEVHRDVLYLPHIIMLLLFVVGLVLPSPRRGGKKHGSSSNKED